MAAAAAFLTSAAMPVLAEQRAPSLIYETPNEFFGSGDFDRDGRTDLVIVDKESGKYRLGYQLTPGVFSWVDCRPSGIKGVAGFSIGRLLATNQEALVFTSPDANQITLVEASSPTAPGKPVTVPFTAALGPNTVVAVDIGGAGKTALADLYVGSIYNSPDPSQATLLRNDRRGVPEARPTRPWPARPCAATAFRSKRASRSCCACWCRETKATRCASRTSAAANRSTVATAADLPAGSDYAVGNFRGSPLREFIVYKPGEQER